MKVNIDWEKLKERGDEHLEFERFCYHIASVMFGEIGTFSYHYNTPGSEFYCEFNKSFEYSGIKYHSGDTIGWQVKFWRGNKGENNSPLDSKHRDELIDGYRKTKGNKPNVKLWIVCTPGSFVERSWETLESELSKIDANCKFTSWHKDVFEDFYLKNPDALNGCFQFYFGERFIDKSKLIEISKDTLSVLKNKYDVDVHTSSEIEKSIIGIINNTNATSKIKNAIEILKKSVDEDRKKPIFDENHWGYKCLTEAFVKMYKDDCNERYNIIEDLYSRFVNNIDLVNESTEIGNLIEEYQKNRYDRKIDLNNELKRIYENHKRENHNIDYYLNELTNRVRKLESLLTRDDEYKNESLSVIIGLINNKVIPVFAEAGYGKTHFACSLTDDLIKTDSPVLLLTGNKFRNCNSCESVIRETFGFSEATSFDDILDYLDVLADTYKHKLPIIIDGLNETAPNEYRWKTELPPLCRKINKHNNLLLITTCREKSDYIEAIYGENNYNKVENYILLNGINKENLEITIKKYFAKYNIKNARLSNVSKFENPLLLKIFCETNKDTENIEINEYSLASCMEKFSNQLIDRIIEKNGRTDRILRIKLGRQIDNISYKLWIKNERTLLLFDEFAREFDDTDTVNKIIDEGLCFSIDKNNGKDLIQFTYDMVAGYHIAKSIIAKCDSVEDFRTFVTNSSDKLFGKIRHPLAEDIIKSIFYIVPKFYGKEWFEICQSENVLEASFCNLDILLSSEKSRSALMSYLAATSINETILTNLLGALSLKSIANNIAYFSQFLPFFVRLSKTELDVYWNSKFATYSDMQNTFSTIHEKFFAEMFSAEDKFVFAAMMCGITDTEYRQKFYWFLNELMMYKPCACISCCERLLLIQDPFIKEIIISVLTGAGLRLKNKNIFHDCVHLLESLIHNSNTTNVVLLDNLETLYAYGEKHYQDTFDRNLLKKNSNIQWPTSNVLTLRLYSIFEYDYDKYNIRPLFQPNYNHTPIYNEIQIYSMLENKILTSGYDDELYQRLEKNEYEATRYRQKYKCTYSFKYGRDALMELYGWLILNKKLDPEYVNTFRTSLISIDPSFPRFPIKKTLVSKFLLPKSLNEINAWIQNSSIDEMKKMIVCILPDRKGEWALINGYLVQNMDERYANIFLSCSSQLVSKNTEVQDLYFREIQEGNEYDLAFASELSWRDLELKGCQVDDSRQIPLIVKYSFSDWSSDRFKYKHFSCLPLAMTEKIGLEFNMDRMSYMLDNEEVSAYFVNDTDFFFFLRKDIVNKILDGYDSKIWYHFFERRIIYRNVSKTTSIKVEKFYEKSEADVFYEG